MLKPHLHDMLHQGVNLSGATPLCSAREAQQSTLDSGDVLRSKNTALTLYSKGRLLLQQAHPVYMPGSAWTQCLPDQLSHLKIWRWCWTCREVVDDGDAHTALNLEHFMLAVRVEGSPLYPRLVWQGRQRPVKHLFPCAMPHY